LSTKCIVPSGLVTVTLYASLFFSIRTTSLTHLQTGTSRGHLRTLFPEQGEFLDYLRNYQIIIKYSFRGAIWHSAIYRCNSEAMSWLFGKNWIIKYCGKGLDFSGLTF
jgi:hypothetical protein